MASSPAGPCTRHFCVSGQRRLPGPAFTHRPSPTGRFHDEQPVPVRSRPGPVVTAAAPGARDCAPRESVVTGQFLLGYAQLVQQLPHGDGVELHPAPRGTLPPHFACFLSCQVPLFLPPGARVIRHRRGSLDRCNAGPSSWELDGGPASLGMRPFFVSTGPLPCVRDLPLPWELSYGRWQVYYRGPETVNSSRLDSFRPSPVQTAPSAAQSWPPATGPPEC